MAIKICFMHYTNWTRVMLPVVFEEFEMVYIFLLQFYFTIIDSETFGQWVYNGHSWSCCPNLLHNYFLGHCSLVTKPDWCRCSLNNRITLLLRLHPHQSGFVANSVLVENDVKKLALCRGGNSNFFLVSDIFVVIFSILFLKVFLVTTT